MVARGGAIAIHDTLFQENTGELTLQSSCPKVDKNVGCRPFFPSLLHHGRLKRATNDPNP